MIIDAGNGQVLHTSEGKQIGSLGKSMFEPYGQERGQKDLVVVGSDHLVMVLDRFTMADLDPLEDFGIITDP